jgi:hypothetical protein
MPSIPGERGYAPGTMLNILLDALPALRSMALD